METIIKKVLKLKIREHPSITIEGNAYPTKVLKLILKGLKKKEFLAEIEGTDLIIKYTDGFFCVKTVC